MHTNIIKYIKTLVSEDLTQYVTTERSEDAYTDVNIRLRINPETSDYELIIGCDYVALPSARHIFLYNLKYNVLQYQTIMTPTIEPKYLVYGVDAINDVIHNLPDCLIISVSENINSDNMSHIGLIVSFEGVRR